MGDKGKSLVKKAQDYFNAFTDRHHDLFTYHDHSLIQDRLALTKEIAKGEDIDKSGYEPGLVALVLCDIGISDSADVRMDKAALINKFLEDSNADSDEKAQVLAYIDFLRSNKFGQTPVERVLRDGKYIHLGLPDALERLELLRLEELKVYDKVYTEIEWLEKCKQYFIAHSLDTRYANRHFGNTRSKNYMELERRINRSRAEEIKIKKAFDKLSEGNTLSDKEGEDLFKIAFRNYLDLVALADRKAGLLIQVNTILASVVGAFGIKRLDENPFYAFPTAAILVGAAVTVFFAILASKPLRRSFYNAIDSDKEVFFFGSFDRLDPRFRDVSWDKYSDDITSFFRGDKKHVFEELIKESYEVRKVLSKKFGFINIAYKVFFAGLLIGIIGFLSVLIHEYYFVKSSFQAYFPGF